MARYALALIALLGTPFLVYCLWNFGRELMPRTSYAIWPSHSSHGVTLSHIPLSRHRSQRHALRLRNQNRTRT